MLSEDEQLEPSLHWPPGYDRTPSRDRDPYPGDLAPTRKESFESIVEELERWDATEGSVTITTASQHYADRPNIPHQHDRPDDVGVAAYYLREDHPADDWHAIACDRWASQRENARAIALWGRRQRLAERCGVTTAQSTHAASRLPPGDDEQAVVAEPAEPRMTREVAADVLGVNVDASDRMVKVAFEEAAKTEHPDQGGAGDVKRLKVARERLLDE